MGCAASAGGGVGEPKAADENSTLGDNEHTPVQPKMGRPALNTGDDFFAGSAATAADYEDPVLRYQGRPHATSLSQKPFRVQVSTADVAANDPCEDRMEVRDMDDTEAIIGLFDGHGGTSASQFCLQHTLNFFLAARKEGLDVAEALSACISRTEEAYLVQCRERHAARDSRGVLAGTCALIVHVNKVARAISVANVGDSRAVLAERDEFGILSASPLSFDHSAQSDYERHRLVSTFGEAAGTAGGSIVHEVFDEYMGEYNRTVHGLTMFTRSIGDYELKYRFAAEFFNGLVPEDKELPMVDEKRPWIIHEPHVIFRQLHHKHEFCTQSTPRKILAVVHCVGIVSVKWRLACNADEPVVLSLGCGRYRGVRRAVGRNVFRHGSVNAPRNMLPCAMVDRFALLVCCCPQPFFRYLVGHFFKLNPKATGNEAADFLLAHALRLVVKRLQKEEPEMGIDTVEQLMQLPPGKQGRRAMHDDISVAVIR